MGGKLLFLDADGVLNKASNFKKRPYDLYYLDPGLITEAQRIVKETNCAIVLSSSWRLNSGAVHEIKKHFQLFDVTPYRPGSLRGEEVRLWIEWHKDSVSRYAILDDNSDFYGSQPLFKTTFDDGLTFDIANRVIRHLNGDENGLKLKRVSDVRAVGTGKKGTSIAPPIVGSPTRRSSSIKKKTD